MALLGVRCIETEELMEKDVSKQKLTLEKDVSKQKNYLDEIMDKVYKDFPIYKFLGKLSKNKIKLPEEVIICVCNSYLKNKSGIKDKWAWFMRTAKECWADYNARKNIVDSADLNKLSECKEIKDLISSITERRIYEIQVNFKY